MMGDISNLIIRADADSAMGTGHVMRCLALAQAWQDKGGKVMFVGQIASQSLQQRIGHEGFLYLEIKRSYPEPDDLQTMLSLIKKDGVADGHWVVVDGYHFTADYARNLREAGAKVVVIDDYAHQPQYQADLLLNQNLGSEEIGYPINSDATILAGSKYVLLRREFLKQTNHAPQDTANVGNHVLVTMGGADPENVTLKVIEALEQVNLSQLEVKIVVGAANPHCHFLEKRMAQVLFKGELLYDVNNMVPLMKWADVAITAGGSTCWELACLGVPLLVIVVADNQKEIAKQLAEHDAAVNLGWAHSLDVEKIANSISAIIAGKSERMKLSANGKLLMDGHGVQRVIWQMEKMS